jgi:MYXO-CTERM domain-containing protein
VSWWPGALPEEPVYHLANEPPCYVNSPEAGWGSMATVRFGVVSLAGAFSGWSAPLSIEYPSEQTDYPEVAAQRERGFSAPASSACAVASGTPAPTAAGLVALMLVGALRRASTRSGPHRSSPNASMKNECIARQLRRSASA